MHKKDVALIILCCCVFIGGMPLPRGFCARIDYVDFGGENWAQIKGKHFIVYYDPGWDIQAAKNVLKVAEQYYQSITDVVGLTRYSDFWKWDQRAKIFIFPDQESFTARTGAPAWSMAYADRDSMLFESRAIVTYQQEQNLLNAILPHEISHLIVHDSIDSGFLPVWVDEGIAQLFEKNKHRIADRMMHVLASQGRYIKLDFLNRWNVRKEKDVKKVELFYAQSLSVIRFLQNSDGDESFRRFCRNLRDGKEVEDALRSAYPIRFRSLQDLEEAWLEYIRTLY